MKKSISIVALLLTSVLLTACAKKESQETQQEASSAVVESTSAEQQAAIDALDQPVLDEKNTDVPVEIANAPADSATPETAASEAVAH